MSRRTLTASPGKYRMGDTVIFEIRSRGARLFLDWPRLGIAEIFATADGRFFCPQLIFSDFGSPWLRFINGRDGKVEKILADDDGGVELSRVD